MSTSGPAGALWSLGETSALLASLPQEWRQLAVAAPTTLSLLWGAGSEILAGRPEAHPRQSLLPNWFRDCIESHECCGIGSWSAPSGTLTTYPTFVHSHDLDRIDAVPPLARHLRDGPETCAMTRLRRLDSLAAAERPCRVLIVGSGRHVEPLLGGAKDLLTRHRPILILDGADLESVGSSLSIDVGAISAVLNERGLSYRPLAVQERAAVTNGRFSILTSNDVDEALLKEAVAKARACPQIADATARCWEASDVCIVANGRRSEKASEVVWTGHPGHLVVLVEIEPRDTEIALELACSTERLRIFANNSPVKRISVFPQCGSGAEPQLMSVGLRATLPSTSSSPRLAFLGIVPVRFSTTERTPDLRLLRLRVSQNS